MYAYKTFSNVTEQGFSAKENPLNLEQMRALQRLHHKLGRAWRFFRDTAKVYNLVLWKKEKEKKTIDVERM